MEYNKSDLPIASLLADASRSRILTALMDGRAKTAKELAYAAGVTASTASFHLGKLVEASLLALAPQGRHRYYRIAREDVADALEAMMALDGRARAHPGNSAPATLAPIQLARFCYDHLAGRLGVALLAALVRKRCLVEQRDRRNFALTRRGKTLLTSIDIDVAEARRCRRRFACGCVDWSERRLHLGGAIGRALAERMIAERWIRRVPESRAVTLSDTGKKALRTHFQIDLTEPV